MLGGAIALSCWGWRPGGDPAHAARTGCSLTIEAVRLNVLTGRLRPAV
jgi:hypothetical protein